MKARISIELSKWELRKCLEAAFEASLALPEEIPSDPETQSIAKHPSRGAVSDTEDLLFKYATILTQWSAHAIDISVKRLTGAMAQYMITARPTSSMALYSELMKIHGQREESMYEVKFLDASRRLYRGIGRIVLPDTTQPATLSDDSSVS